MKFDGENWTVYDMDNSGLPSNGISALAIDVQGNIWIGTWGLARFDGTNWTVYNTDNSGLPNNGTLALAIDAQGNTWIGTNGGGLGVYRKGGVILPGGVTAVGEELDTKVPSAFSLSQNYPNPFNAATEMSFSVPTSSHVKIAIYNVLGQLVRELADGAYAPGVYRVRWDGTDSANRPVSSGVYFVRMTADTGAAKAIGTIAKKMMLLE